MSYFTVAGMAALALSFKDLCRVTVPPLVVRVSILYSPLDFLSWKRVTVLGEGLGAGLSFESFSASSSGSSSESLSDGASGVAVGVASDDAVGTMVAGAVGSGLSDAVGIPLGDTSGAILGDVEEAVFGDADGVSVGVVGEELGVAIGIGLPCVPSEEMVSPEEYTSVWSRSK